MHHCLGVTGGKHIAMKKPAHSGLVGHNNKSYFGKATSCYLWRALKLHCNRHWRIYRSNNDCGVLLNSRMGSDIDLISVHLKP